MGDWTSQNWTKRDGRNNQEQEQQQQQQQQQEKKATYKTAAELAVKKRSSPQTPSVYIRCCGLDKLLSQYQNKPMLNLRSDYLFS